MKLVLRRQVDRREVPEHYECIVRFVDPDCVVYLDSGGDRSVSRDDFICNRKDHYREETSRCRVLQGDVIYDAYGNVIDVSENLDILERVGVKIILSRKENPRGRDFDDILGQIPVEWMKEPFILEYTVSVPVHRELPFHLTRVVVYKTLGSPRPHDDDDLDECMICLSNVPDTLVIPCMHRVVCRQCSVRLKSTPDRNTCVRCRNPIETVYQDET